MGKVLHDPYPRPLQDVPSLEDAKTVTLGIPERYDGSPDPVSQGTVVVSPDLQDIAKGVRFNIPDYNEWRKERNGIDRGPGYYSIRDDEVTAVFNEIRDDILLDNLPVNRLTFQQNDNYPGLIAVDMGYHHSFSGHDYFLAGFECQKSDLFSMKSHEMRDFLIKNVAECCPNVSIQRFTESVALDMANEQSKQARSEAVLFKSDSPDAFESRAHNSTHTKPPTDEELAALLSEPPSRGDKIADIDSRSDSNGRPVRTSTAGRDELMRIREERMKRFGISSDGDKPEKQDGLFFSLTPEEMEEFSGDSSFDDLGDLFT